VYSLSAHLTESNNRFEIIYNAFIASNVPIYVPVWSSTCDSNYLTIQLVQNRYHRATLLSGLHDTVNTNLIQDSIHRITAECFVNSSLHSKPLILQTENYPLDDRISMRNKYKI
jgi:hypothetical protein